MVEQMTLPALARTDDPESAHLAAQAVTPSVGALERAILEHTARTFKLSAFTIAAVIGEVHRGRWSEGTIRTRVSAMGKRGLLIRHPKWGKSPRGQVCDGWSKP